MKKILSLSLAIMMLVSAVPTAFAADTQDYSQGTQVVYTAENNESYFITVPARLNPGQSGTVTLDGMWPSDKTISVTAESTVTLTNSILVSDQKVLDVTFLGISKAGNDTTAQTFTETVSVADIENALFGTWSGKFNYNVDASDAFTSTTASGSSVFVNDVSPTQHDLKVSLSSDTITDYSNTTVKVLGQNLLDADAWVHDKGFAANDDGTYTLSKNPNDYRFTKSYPIHIPAGQTIQFTASLVDCSCENPNDLYAEMFLLTFFEDGTTDHIAVEFNGNQIATKALTFEKDIVDIRLYLNGTVPDGTYVTMENLQIAIRAEGETLEYVPYTVQEAVANADGTVTGLKSVSPTMFIYTDNDEVQIECEYNSVKKN